MTAPDQTRHRPNTLKGIIGGYTPCLNATLAGDATPYPIPKPLSALIK